MDQTLFELKKNLMQKFKPLSDHPSDLVRELLSFYMQKSPSELLALRPDMIIDRALLEVIHQASDRLTIGEPLAYVIGEAWFFERRFLVGQGVLIPRPDTEVLVERALEIIDEDDVDRILECATGSACISISILDTIRQRQDGTLILQVLATEISDQAIQYASLNRAHYGLEDQLAIEKCDLFPDTNLKFDLLLSNPPYIDQEDMEALDPSVKYFEPSLALAGGADGLDFYWRIYKEAKAYLKPGARLLCEHGYQQADSIQAIIEAVGGYRDIVLHKDYAGRPRVMECRYIEERED